MVHRLFLRKFASKKMKTNILLIKRGKVVTFQNDRLISFESDILVKGDKIVEIAKNIEHPHANVEIDASGMIVLPGFIDTHRHLWETAFKGIAGNWTLMEYLNRMLGEIAPAFSAYDVYIGNLLGALEALNAGITTVFDWSHIMNTPEHTEAAIEGLKDAGIRAKFGYGTPGTSVWEWFYESRLKHPLEAKKVKEGHFSSNDELVTMALAIRGPEYSELEIAKHDILLGRELDVQISMHIGGGTFGPKYEGVQKLHREKLLGPDLNFAHANTISERDFELLANHGCSISITPEVELQMGLGLPATGRALLHGVTCGLGVDITTATSGNMFDQMKVALQTERAIRNEKLHRTGEMPDKLTITDADVLKMATLGGAETMGLGNKVGTLEVGKQADIILIDTQNLSLSPSLNPVSTVVLYAKEQHVDTVMVAGKLVKRHGKLLGFDMTRLLQQAKSSSEKVLKKPTYA